jgi:hypothetical protein
MPNKDYLPTKDTDLQAWTQNFLAVANANLAPLGLIAGDITPVTTDKTNFDTAITNNNTKQAEAKAATQQKNTVKTNMSTKIRVLVRKIQANPAVLPQLKAQLGINIGDTIPTPLVPQQPTELVANPSASGVNKLQWNRNGNPFGTTFIIESQENIGLPWVFAGTTSKATFEHNGQIPGKMLFYRVKAQRNEQLSESSNVAVVYAAGAPVPPVLV